MQREQQREEEEEHVAAAAAAMAAEGTDDAAAGSAGDEVVSEATSALVASYLGDLVLMRNEFEELESRLTSEVAEDGDEIERARAARLSFFTQHVRNVTERVEKARTGALVCRKHAGLWHPTLTLSALRAIRHCTCAYRRISIYRFAGSGAAGSHRVSPSSCERPAGATAQHARASFRRLRARASAMPLYSP